MFEMNQEFEKNSDIQSVVQRYRDKIKKFECKEFQEEILWSSDSNEPSNKEIVVEAYVARDMLCFMQDLFMKKSKVASESAERKLHFYLEKLTMYSYLDQEFTLRLEKIEKEIFNNSEVSFMEKCQNFYESLTLGELEVLGW
jgi:hypothetical protein